MRSGEQSSRTRAFLTSLFCRPEAAAGVTLARALWAADRGRSGLEGHHSTGRGFGGAERTCRESRKQKPRELPFSGISFARQAGHYETSPGVLAPVFLA
jgi:hypothetical protein